MAGTLVSTEVDPALADRYRGRPLLILLENFVLACIGALPEDRSRQVADAARRAFAAPADADWMEVVRAELELGPTICEAIQQRWAAAVALLEAAGEAADPVEFARGIVDGNFADLIDASGE